MWKLHSSVILVPVFYTPNFYDVLNMWHLWHLFVYFTLIFCALCRSEDSFMKSDFFPGDILFAFLCCKWGVKQYTFYHFTLFLWPSLCHFETPKFLLSSHPSMYGFCLFCCCASVSSTVSMSALSWDHFQHDVADRVMSSTSSSPATFFECSFHEKVFHWAVLGCWLFWRLRLAWRRWKEERADLHRSDLHCHVFVFIGCP